MRLPAKPLEGATVTLTLPASWTWRLRLTLLLVRLAFWISGARVVVESCENGGTAESGA